MQQFNKHDYQQMVVIAAQYVSAAVEKNLPDSTQKDFMRWMLAEGSPYQEDYLRMMGVAGSIELELALLDSLIDRDILKKMQPAIGLLNAYFAFETLSDNIGIGLGAAHRNNLTYIAQRDLLRAFNQAMIAKLNDSPRSAVELLTPYLSLTEKISAYEHCLLPTQMYEFAKKFQEQFPAAPLAELEHSFFAILVLNITTCVDLVNFLNNHPLHDYLKTTLIDRYAAVTATLNSEARFTSSELADIGTKSMLVMPSLAFCIAALDLASPNNKIAAAIDNHLLTDALYSGSLLVRLLNDIGTQLLELDDVQRQELFIELDNTLQAENFNSIFELLLNKAQSEKYFSMMTRLRKDITHGEYNICLDNFENNQDVASALTEFKARLTFFSKLYQEQVQKLHDQCKRLTEFLADARPGQITLNFVKFHQIMYSKEFETKYGDYAITSTVVNKSNKFK